MYVDNTVIYTHARNREQPASVLHKVSDWLTSSCLTLVVSKTVGMYFSNKRKGEVIQIVDNFKYLGIIIDSNLTFKKHVNNHIQKCQINWYILDILDINYQYMPLNYLCIQWSFHIYHIVLQSGPRQVWQCLNPLETGCEGFSYKKYQEITTTVPL